MKKLIVFALCFISFSSFAQKEKPDKRFKGIDTAFARILDEWHAAGFAVAVVEKDKLIYSNGFGYRDLDKKIPVTINTQFAIGSCSKAFTTSLLGLLRNDKLLDFDKPVRNYLPELKFYNNEMNNHITLTDMMSHRTGLPRHDLSWYFFSTASMDSLIKRIEYMEPSAGLREKWQYNNFMYLAQGAVIEKLTHKSWEDNIREKLFLPLGMTQSNVSLKEWLAYPEASFGYDVVKEKADKMDYYDISAMAPAGSINSTVNDMAKWLITWINGGRYNGKEILPTSFIKEAMSSQMVISGALPDKEFSDIYLANYGLGWGLSSYRGHYRVEHGGNIDGFSASTAFFPSDSIGIVVLSNQNGSPIPGIVRNLLADRLLHLPYKDWQSIQKNARDKAEKANKEAEKSHASNQKKGTHPSHPMKDYEGIYYHPGFGNIKVDYKKDSLNATMGKYNFWLKHYHYDVFEGLYKNAKTGIDTSGDFNLKFLFTQNENGNMEGISIPMESSVKNIVFSKVPEVKPISKDSLQKYVGEYELAGMLIKIYIKSGDILVMMVPGQPEYELQWLGDDKFALKNLKGFTAQFIRNEKSEITGLISQQPNGNFKAVKKK